MTTPRKIRGDATLTYTVNGEAWYAKSLSADDRASLDIGADTEPGAGYWEFIVTELDLGGWGIRLTIHGENFDAFADIPEFFEALRVEEPTRLAGVRAILNRLGAVDVTARVRGQRQTVWEAPIRVKR